MPATPDHPQMHGALMAFQLPRGHDPVALRGRLWDQRIEMPVIERPDRLLVRTSTHFYNTEAEIDTLAAALESILPACRA
jgi:isopenicillin-N epimerase